MKIPVVTLEAESLQTWATVVAAAGIAPPPGFVFNLSDLKQYQQAFQQTPDRLAKSTPVHVAEVFMSGLLQLTGINQKTQQPVYDFKTKEVRRLLN